MKRIFKMMMMAALAVALAGCGSDDEEVINEPTRQIDAALTGTWVKWNPLVEKEINEAASFKADGQVLLMVSGTGQYSGGWYHGDYSITDDGQIQTHVSKIRMQNFRSFDDYEAYAANPTYNDWYFSYTISGNTLTLKHEGYNNTWTLERLEE